jgi:hypothetical protein
MFDEADSSNALHTVVLFKVRLQSSEAGRRLFLKSCFPEACSLDEFIVPFCGRFGRTDEHP